MQEIFGNNITPNVDITVININTTSWRVRVSPSCVCNDSGAAVAASNQTFMIKQLYQIVFLTIFSCFMMFNIEHLFCLFCSKEWWRKIYFNVSSNTICQINGYFLFTFYVDVKGMGTKSLS